MALGEHTAWADSKELHVRVSWPSHYLRDLQGIQYPSTNISSVKTTRRNRNFLSQYQMYFWHFQEGTESEKQFQLIPPKRSSSFSFLPSSWTTPSNSVLGAGSFLANSELFKKNTLSVSLKMFPSEFKVFFKNLPGSRKYR